MFLFYVSSIACIKRQHCFNLVTFWSFKKFFSIKGQDFCLIFTALKLEKLKWIVSEQAGCSKIGVSTGKDHMFTHTEKEENAKDIYCKRRQ
jgi:hypothetical protein